MSDTKQQSQEEFEAEQQAAAEAQNAPGSVPEKRPIASQQPNSDQTSALTQRQNEEGKNDPMPKEAYEKAEKEPTKASLKKHKSESLKQCDRVKVIDEDHEHFGSMGAVVEVTYADDAERAKAASGDPALANYAGVSNVMIRTRGGSHALVSLKVDQVEKLGRREPYQSEE